jgi:hypothetical protein
MYGVERRARAEKDIAALPPAVTRRVLRLIATLAENPGPPAFGSSRSKAVTASGWATTESFSRLTIKRAQ